MASGYFWTSGISLVLYRWTLVILWIGGLWLFCGLVEFISENTSVFCLLCGLMEFDKLCTSGLWLFCRLEEFV